MINLKSKSQSSTCINCDFEQASLSCFVPCTLTISSTTGANGWTADEGTNTGTVTSCNINSCCTNPPSAMKIIGTTTNTGYIDPNIGSSYPIYSVFGTYTTTNASSFYPNFGNWFCKINDDVANYSIHKLSKTSGVINPNAFYRVAVLPVMNSVGHSCCNSPSLKIVLKNSTGTPITSNNFSIVPTTSCSSVANWSVCALNSSYSYSGWKIYNFPVNSNTLTTLDISILDCKDGLHSGYAYIDSEIFDFDIIANATSFTNFSTPIKLCGATCATLSAPTGFSTYLWNGPDVNVNGVTSRTVNACVNGAYTLTVNDPNFITPYKVTFTLNCVPNPTTTLSVAQSTTCAGFSPIILTGLPSGGIYSGINVVGNSFNPISVGNYTVSYKYTDANGCKDSTSKTINVLNCTNVVELNSHQNVYVFPNPNSGSFTLQSKEDVLLEIINELGQLVKTLKLDASNNHQTTITSLSDGVYFLKDKLSGKVNKNKIVVAR